jgi:hypothetical protein
MDFLAKRGGSIALGVSAALLLSACSVSLAGIWIFNSGIDIGRDRVAWSVFIAPGHWVIGFRTLEQTFTSPAAYMLSAGECSASASAIGLCGGAHEVSSCIGNNRFYVCLFVGDMRSGCLTSVGPQDPNGRRGAALSQHRPVAAHMPRLLHVP